MYAHFSLIFPGRLIRLSDLRLDFIGISDPIGLNVELVDLGLLKKTFLSFIIRFCW